MTREELLAQLARERSERRYAFVVLLALASAYLLAAAVYGRAVYGTWRCGLPGIECRIEVSR